MTVRTRAIAACASVCALLLVAGCGGDDEKQTSTAATQTEATATAKPKSAKQQGAPEKTQPEPTTTEGAPQSTIPDAGPTPGSKQAAAGVPVNPGGDNSVQTHGTEAANAERRQAAATLQAYLSDRAAGRWARACSLLAAPTRREIGRFLGDGQDGEDAGSCPQAIRALTDGLPAAALRASAQIDLVLSFRTRGRQGFLLYNGPPGKTLYVATMALEDGRWQVAALAPFALPV